MGVVLRKLPGTSQNSDLYQETSKSEKCNLTLVLDFDKQPRTECLEIITSIRRLGEFLQGDYLTVKVLLTNLPAIYDLEISRPWEEYIHYDKERQGLQKSLF